MTAEATIPIGAGYRMLVERDGTRIFIKPDGSCVRTAEDSRVFAALAGVDAGEIDMADDDLPEPLPAMARRYGRMLRALRRHFPEMDSIGVHGREPRTIALMRASELQVLLDHVALEGAGANA